jgi:GNAT superfamily N-acetyltransferase
VRIRGAAASDADVIGSIWYSAEGALGSGLPPLAPLPWWQHLVDAADVWIAEVDGRPAGFAATLDLGPAVVLTDFFVHPDHQHQGIGTALLRQALPEERQLATLSSADPRAVASYIARGLRPRWPAFFLAGSRRLDLPGGVSVVEDDVALDGLRPSERSYLADRCGGIPGVVLRGGRAIGSVVVSPRSPFRLVGRDEGTVLLTTATTAADSGDVVHAGAAWCEQLGAPRVSVQLPGPHPALRRLLLLGYRLTDADTACATSAAVLPEPERESFWSDLLRLRT